MKCKQSSVFIFVLGICLYERFQRIQQRLREGQQACDLLFYVALQSLKFSFEMAFESKMGNSEVDKLLAGFAESDRQEELKAQKKREKKKKQKQKKDQAVASINDFSADMTSAVTGSAGSSPPALNSCPFQSNAGQRAANSGSESETAVVDVPLPAKEAVSADKCKQTAAVVQKHWLVFFFMFVYLSMDFLIYGQNCCQFFSADLPT